MERGKSNVENNRGDEMRSPIMGSAICKRCVVSGEFTLTRVMASNISTSI